MKSIKATHTFGDKGYAGVPERLLEFRQDNPRASIETESTVNPDGSVTFKTIIVKDRSDEYSATATGTARYSELEMKKPKAFEKLETVSVGRALSLLGYLNNGQIATTEEMEEFESYRADKVESAIEQIKTAKGRDEFAKILAKLSVEQQKEVTPVIRERLKELTNG